MFLDFLRHNRIAAGVLTFLRLYIGFQWLMAGFGKITGGEFNAGGFIQAAISGATGENPTVQTWWAVFLENVALPQADIFSFVVMWGEFLVGAALILGLFTNFAALMGLFMNFAYLFSGTVSTNAQMVVLTLFVLIAGYNAGRFGLDRWVMPVIAKYKPEKEEGQRKAISA